MAELNQGQAEFLDVAEVAYPEELFLEAGDNEARQRQRLILKAKPAPHSAAAFLMMIEIRDPELLSRLQRLIASSGSSGPEDLLARLITTQEEQDRWLMEQRDENAAKIRHGLAQLDRGESIPDHEIAAYLDAHRQRS